MLIVQAAAASTAPIIESVVKMSAVVPAWVNLCARAAPIAAIGVSMAPLPTIQNIAKEGSVGNLPLLPYTSMVVNAFVWVVYGLLIRNSIVWVPNAIGLSFGLYYVSKFQNYCPAGKSNLPGTFSQQVYTAMLILTFTFITGFTLPLKKATQLIGYEGVFFCVLLFASPLAAMKTVIQNRSAKSIPLPFTLACLVNCTLWSVVGLLQMKDFNIYFPNLLGLSCAVAQILLRSVFGAGSGSNFKGPPEIGMV